MSIKYPNAEMKSMVAKMRKLGFYTMVDQRWTKKLYRSIMLSSPPPNDGYAVRAHDDGRWTFYEFTDHFVPAHEGHGEAELEAFIAKRWPKE